MGKAGKARKRQRLERELLNGKKEEEPPQPVEDSGDEDASLSEDESGAEEPQGAGTTNEHGMDDEKRAIAMLDLLGRRLDIWSSKKLKAVRTTLFPLISGQHKRRAFFEPPDWPADCPPPDDAEVARTLTPAALAILTRVATGLLALDPVDCFTSPETKAFRRALHPLVVEFSRKEGGRGGAPIIDVEHRSLSALISAAFRRRDWAEALALLTRMRQPGKEGEKPRLGALQRWVRDCDLAATEDGDKAQQEGVEEKNMSGKDMSDKNVSEKDMSEKDMSNKRNMSLLLLDAVLRVAALDTPATSAPPPLAASDDGTASTTPTPPVAQTNSSSPSSSSPLSLPSVAVVCRHPPYRPPLPLSSPAPTFPTPDDPWDVTSLGLHVVSHVPAAQRRPPSNHDLNIYATSPGAIRPLPPSSPLSDDAPEPLPPSPSPSHDAPEPAQGLTTLRPTRYDIPGVPGAFLMADILTPSECRRIITAAEHIGYAADAVLGIDCVQWLADPSLLDPIYARCQPLLPPSIAGGRLCGVNARWRLFRYTPGAVYRPHIDGAWPGSGFDAEGKYTDDAYKGSRVSRLTFLVYLNGGFQGGGTTFFLPGEKGPGHIEARSVEPREGSVLCFPHGDSQGSLVHEGSAVAEGGVKYVIRSDVLYAVKP